MIWYALAGLLIAFIGCFIEYQDKGYVTIGDVIGHSLLIFFWGFIVIGIIAPFLYDAWDDVTKEYESSLKKVVIGVWLPPKDESDA